MISAHETTLGRILRLTVATVVVAAFSFPLLSILVTSFQGQGAAANYSAVLSQTPFIRSAVNSAMISVGTVALVYVCTMLAGFAFSKMNFLGKKLLFNALLVGLVLPVMTIIVPILIVLERLGLFSHAIAVIVPLAAVLVPFTVLLAKGFLDSLPDEILEAARIDGASSFVTLLRIVLPLSAPISAVIVVWTFLQSWNEFFLPLLVLQDGESRVITQIPLFFTSQYGSDVPKIFAALVLMSVPVIVAYICAQKLFERGLTAGSLK